MPKEDRERLVEYETPDVVVHNPSAGRKPGKKEEDEDSPSCGWGWWFALLLIFFSPAVYCFIKHAVVPMFLGPPHLEHPSSHVTHPHLDHPLSNNTAGRIP